MLPAGLAFDVPDHLFSRYFVPHYWLLVPSSLRGKVSLDFTALCVSHLLKRNMAFLRVSIFLLDQADELIALDAHRFHAVAGEFAHHSLAGSRVCFHLPSNSPLLML